MDDLALAHLLADAADRITLARFRAGDLRVTSKPDLTPVSDADTATETMLRALIAEHRPGDAVLGEEEGLIGDGPRRWVVDPIDGTKNYVRGVPVWATLVALQVAGVTNVGVVSAPALGRRWWAALGHGAWAGTQDDATRLHVSGVAQLADASLSYSSLPGWERQGRLPGLLALSQQVWRTRAYGDFWSHVLVAEGAVDASFEPEVSVWDLAALEPILTEAGGTFSDLAGRPGPDGGSVVCSNGLLHDAVLQGPEMSEVPPSSGRARDLVRKRRGDYRAPETGRHHHIGAAPERQPMLDEHGSAYVETAPVQLAQRTVAQLGVQRERLVTAMGRAADDQDYERAAALRDDLAAVDTELSRRVTPG